MAGNSTNGIGRETVGKILALRDHWHTKHHPFYVDFANGKFGLAPVAAMMAQHYRHTQIALPSLGILFSKAPADGRRFVLETLAEEEGLVAGPGDDREAHDHGELILRFCRTAGLSDEQVKATEQLPGWRARTYFYIHTVREEPFGVVVAMQSTQEGQQPGINAERMLPAFETHHGLTRDNPVIEFFSEHMVADADHSGRQIELAEKYITTDELQQRALQVAEIALKNRWACMNDIYRRAVLGETDLLPQ
jgi:pyrroloquinoline quinone (PQQ) biosynthesis protein C